MTKEEWVNLRTTTPSDFTPSKEDWAKLRAVFPADQIEKLPKQIKKDAPGERQPRGRCVQGSDFSADGIFCGAYHARSVHLDYVGHAGVTDRLNEVCTPAGWDWEPMVLHPNGTPYYDADGMWIKLTIWGVTKLGHGDAQGKSGPNAIKELIGDAIRNAGLRFGIATYLWSKSEAAKNRAEIVEAPTPRSEAWEFLVTALPSASDAQRVAVAAKDLAVFGVEPKAAQSEHWAYLLAHWQRAGVDLPADPAPKMIDARTSKALHAHFNSVGLREREHYIPYVATTLGREIETTGDLTEDEARQVIAALRELEQGND